ncbi:MAG TPA: hypothetical protein VJ725_02210 [Thermoanaerobaculia bacterium]|nr:hypothetical protein [Thermoanaerobaculia bacterium]
MDRTLARRATAAALVLLATLCLAAGPAAATPAVSGPSAPEANLWESLWSWIAGLWTAAGPEPSFEKAVSDGTSSTTDTKTSDPVIDKGVLIDPNGLR